MLSETAYEAFHNDRDRRSSRFGCVNDDLILAFAIVIGILGEMNICRPIFGHIRKIQVDHRRCIVESIDPGMHRQRIGGVDVIFPMCTVI